MSMVTITVTNEDGEVLDSVTVPWTEFEDGDWAMALQIGDEETAGPQGEREAKKA